MQELGGARVFAEELALPTRLVIVGATDTAEELCRSAGALGWRTVVIDPRPRLATKERLPSAGEIVVAWPDDLRQTPTRRSSSSRTRSGSTTPH